MTKTITLVVGDQADGYECDYGACNAPAAYRIERTEGPESYACPAHLGGFLGELARVLLATTEGRRSKHIGPGLRS